MFACDVGSFSSQYGKEESHSYTAANLANSYSRWPHYGDYSECFVLRTYGRWWNMLGSKMATSKRPRFGFISKDYIELLYEKKVVVTSVQIYETYHPGGVVALYAFDYKTNKWIRIWSIFDDNSFKNNYEAINRVLPPKQTRVFKPELRRKDIYTDLIRLEFEDSNQDYYIELDAVQLEGYVHEYYRNAKQVAENFDSLSKQFTKELVIESNKVIEEPKQEQNQIVPDNSYDIVKLPHEVLNLILNKLDLISVLKLRTTSKLFRSICSDSLSYTELDLQPYWHLVNDSFIELMISLAHQITFLNLSWTKNLDAKLTEQLMVNSSQTLKVLKLACCDYLTDNMLEAISLNCSNITEFDLHSCQLVNKLSVIENLKKLKKLNLYRTNSKTSDIVSIVKGCSELEYINLGSCMYIREFDEVLSNIATHLPNIKGLDLWRAYSLTSNGIIAIAEQCRKLEELDIGWVKLGSFDCLGMLARNCPNLKKIFLTAHRISDIELEYFSRFSHELEQIDILGSSGVSLTVVENILKNCKKLKFFDISFCQKIDMVTAKRLAQNYPHCAIKKSFQNE